jgi:hypothetical protein
MQPASIARSLTASGMLGTVTVVIS